MYRIVEWEFVQRPASGKRMPNSQKFQIYAEDVGEFVIRFLKDKGPPAGYVVGGLVCGEGKFTELVEWLQEYPLDF